MPSSINSNTLFQTIAVAVLLAHVSALVGVKYSPHGLGFLLAVNAILAFAVLIYAASRARYIVAAADWPYLALIIFELMVLVGAFCAFRDSRLSVLWSYVAFGLHVGASIAAVVFAFAFKMTRLM